MRPAARPGQGSVQAARPETSGGQLPPAPLGLSLCQWEGAKSMSNDGEEKAGQCSVAPRCLPSPHAGPSFLSRSPFRGLWAWTSFSTGPRKTQASRVFKSLLRPGFCRPALSASLARPSGELPLRPPQAAPPLAAGPGTQSYTCLATRPARGPKSNRSVHLSRPASSWLTLPGRQEQAPRGALNG